VSPLLVHPDTELTIVLHRLKLVHTDLKPENILLVSNESRLAGPRVCERLQEAVNDADLSRRQVLNPGQS
jgi:serine/threonine protein kinase